MVETQTENKKPIKHDLRMKYCAESFSVTPNLVWKGEFKKDIISSYEWKQEKYNNQYKYATEEYVMHGNGKEIHENLMETNETYALYFKEFGKRNTLTITTNEDFCAYLDVLIEEGILTVNLNTYEKTRIQIETDLYNKLIKDIEELQIVVENELKSAVNEINKPESYKEISVYNVLNHNDRGYTDRIHELEDKVHDLFKYKGEIDRLKSLKSRYESQRDEKFF